MQAGERRRGRAHAHAPRSQRRLSFAPPRLDAWYQRRQRRQRRRRMRRRCRRRVTFLRQKRHVLNVRVDREERVVARRVSPAAPHLCGVQRCTQCTYGTPEGRGTYSMCVEPKGKMPCASGTSTEGARSRFVRRSPFAQCAYICQHNAARESRSPNPAPSLASRGRPTRHRSFAPPPPPRPSSAPAAVSGPAQAGLRTPQLPRPFPSDRRGPWYASRAV